MDKKTILLFIVHQSLGKFCHMATSRYSSRKYQKNQSLLTSNIELILIHMVLELGVLCIAKKLLMSFGKLEKNLIK